ncbi:unnamed protein product [Echinostoma caproni]|uniref:Uncharacterized protein n=1 Tax=Echinostoma caproni TaxID=27848 RepID=A0A3P8IKG4_9TREM|nr:unnamed protein product [Echinostoma caproni]
MSGTTHPTNHSYSRDLCSSRMDSQITSGTVPESSRR